MRVGLLCGRSVGQFGTGHGIVVVAVVRLDEEDLVAVGIR